MKKIATAMMRALSIRRRDSGYGWFHYHQI